MIDRSFDAWEAGYPMNRFITLAWGKSQVDARDAVEITGKFIACAREWMRSHGYPMPWVWVQEYGDRFGQHAHILLHVPLELDPLFRTMPLRWSKALLRGGYVTKTLETQRLDFARACESNPEAYKAALAGKLHYMLKCAPEALERRLGLEGCGHKQWGQRSYVVSKRAGVWQKRDWERKSD
ncbi:MAG: hypothetical protein AAF697_14300 [Pseudomonadota bacterium]